MKTISIITLLIFIGVITCTAAVLDTTGTPHDTTKISKQNPDSFNIVSISHHGNTRNQPDEYSIDEYLYIELRENVDSLFKYHKEDLTLWIDGICFPNNKLWRRNEGNNGLIFCLSRDSINLSSHLSSWNYFYDFYNRGWFWNHANRKVTIQIGNDKTIITKGKVNNRIIIKIRERWHVTVGYIFLILLVFFFYWLVIKKHILQTCADLDDKVEVVDTFSSDPVRQANQVLKKDLPYSLARAQLLFWLLLVAGSAIFIWFNTDNMIVITTSAAMLIGISGGTSVLTKIIESHPQTAVKYTAAQFNENKKSESFFKDILSDSNDYSIARVQMLVFTLIIGAVFLWHVVYFLEMPELSQGLMLLMGVSSSTYAGVKFSEK